MKPKLHSFTTLSVFGALLGCAQIAPSPPVAQPRTVGSQTARMPVKVTAVRPAPQGASAAEVLFSVGRYEHNAGQLAQAAAHYTQALELDPDHVGALNALAVIHAQSGRTAEALKLFSRALALSPKAAHVHNNMGYALMRAGRLDEAGERLREARTLDPASLQASQNLALLAKEEGRRAALAAGPASAPPAQPSPTAGVSGPQFVAVSPNVFELRMPAPAALPVAQAGTLPPAKAAVVPALPSQPVQAVAPVVAAGASSQALPVVERPMPTPLVAASMKPESTVGRQEMAATVKLDFNALKGVRLEISNGVGITRLARRTADRLAPTGIITARLTNALPYRQVRTEIQYMAGADLSAQALQARLPVTATKVASSTLERGVQIRLVLGHDVAGRDLAAWLDEEAGPVAQQQLIGGWMLT